MGEYTYSLVASHCSELLVFMDEQRKAKDENLCDVRFIVGSDCVYAHRGVLAVCSAYFQVMLNVVVVFGFVKTYLLLGW